MPPMLLVSEVLGSLCSMVLKVTAVILTNPNSDNMELSNEKIA